MSPSTPENIGRRRFLVHRDKAVEYALDRVRRAAHAEYGSLSAEERAGLKTSLEEIWMNIPRERWHEYCFSTLTRQDIVEILALGRDIQSRYHMTIETKQALETILLSCSKNNHQGSQKGPR
jgi:hypothetical protein